MRKKFVPCVAAALAAIVMLSGCGNSTSALSASSAASDVEASDSQAEGTTESEDSPVAITTMEDAYSIGLKDNGYYKDVKAKKLVTLPKDYAHVKISRDDITDENGEVESTIQQVTYSYGEREKVDRRAEEGDEVVLDYVGTVDGVAFEGSTVTDSTLVIDSTSNNLGFENDLIGHLAGDEFDVSVKLMEGYPDSKDAEGNTVTLSGATVDYHITVKEVREIYLTDEDVAEKLATQGFTMKDGSAVDTVEKMKQFYREQYEDNVFERMVYNYIIENTTVKELPEKVLENARESYRAEINTVLTAYKLTEEEYCKQAGSDAKTIDELMESLDDKIQDEVKSRLIIQAIAEKQHFKVTDEDINEYFQNDTLSVQQATKYYGEAFLKQNVLGNKVYTWLVDNATLD